MKLKGKTAFLCNIHSDSSGGIRYTELSMGVSLSESVESHRYEPEAAYFYFWLGSGLTGLAVNLVQQHDPNIPRKRVI